MKRTGVVLVNWNGGEFTIPCLRSLLSGSVRPDKIVVVDNASVDGSARKISTEFPEVALIENAENLGFSAANNQGIGLLLDSGADNIWLLNNDTVVSEDCLKILAAASDSHQAMAGFSGKILRDSVQEQLWYAGAYRHSLHGAPKHILDRSLERGADGVVPVPFISGCCMYVPARVFRKYGGLNEKFFAYYEDSEWCWRVANDGGKFGYVPQALLTHKVSASVRKNSGSQDAFPLAAYLMNRNQLWTVRLRSGSGFKKTLYVFFNVLIQSRNILTAILRGRLRPVAGMYKSLHEGLFAKVPTDIPFW